MISNAIVISAILDFNEPAAVWTMFTSWVFAMVAVVSCAVAICKHRNIVPILVAIFFLVAAGKNY